MKKKIIKIFSSIVFCLLSFVFYSQQNLVPNNSFEVVDTCPAPGYSPSNFAKYWFDIRNTPDYYNTCDTSGGSYNVPKNIFGYQCPATGYAYLGLLITSPSWFNSGSQEVAGCKLIDSVVKNTKYFFSCKVSLSGGIGVGYAVKKIGCKLTTKKLPKIFPNSSSTDYIVNNYATFYHNGNYLTDTLNWVIIKGSFIADSNYKYFNIGAFHSYQNIDTINALNNGGQSSYYYLDDVCLSTDSNNCNIPNQINCLTTNLKETNVLQSQMFYPNPCDRSFIVNSKTIISTYKILSLYGRTMQQGAILNEKEIFVYTIPSGIYFIEFTINERYSRYKLIINH